MVPTVRMVKSFLQKVDQIFPTALSEKQKLDEFADKLCTKATLCAAYEGNEIVSMVAGYTENIVDNKAYISIVATCPEKQGRGYASKLVKEFIAICDTKGIEAVHLYAASVNCPALNMYARLGFEEWIIPNEPRPEDIHLIYYLKK